MFVELIYGSILDNGERGVFIKLKGFISKYVWCLVIIDGFYKCEFRNKFL